MGMFDTITVDPVILPSIEGVTYPATGWQTKCLTNTLLDWSLDKEGIRRVKNEEGVEPVHGTVIFYHAVKAGDKAIWAEFKGYFTYGKLDKVVLLSSEETSSALLDSQDDYVEPAKSGEQLDALNYELGKLGAGFKVERALCYSDRHVPLSLEYHDKKLKDMWLVIVTYLYPSPAEYQKIVNGGRSEAKALMTRVWSINQHKAREHKKKLKEELNEADKLLSSVTAYRNRNDRYDLEDFRG